MGSQKTVQRQITFTEKLYSDVSKEADSENERLGKVLRKDKIHIQDIIPILVQDGLNSRKGQVFTPSDRQVQFSKDDKWLKLKAKAETALTELLQYQGELLFEVKE